MLNEYSRVHDHGNHQDLFAWLKSRSPIGKVVLLVSAASALAALVLIISVLIPMYRPQSLPANVVEAVLSSKDVKAALGNDELATVTANDLGNHLLEVIVDSGGGAIIIAG